MQHCLGLRLAGSFSGPRRRKAQRGTPGTLPSPRKREICAFMGDINTPNVWNVWRISSYTVPWRWPVRTLDMHRNPVFHDHPQRYAAGCAGRNATIRSSRPSMRTTAAQRSVLATGNAPLASGFERLTCKSSYTRNGGLGGAGRDPFKYLYCLAVICSARV